MFHLKTPLPTFCVFIPTNTDALVLGLTLVPHILVNLKVLMKVLMSV